MDVLQGCGERDIWERDGTGSMPVLLESLAERLSGECPKTMLECTPKKLRYGDGVPTNPADMLSLCTGTVRQRTGKVPSRPSAYYYIAVRHDDLMADPFDSGQNRRM